MKGFLMKIPVINLFILLAFASAFAGCKGELFDFDSDKEDDLKLPPATQSGKNTFGCKIDGKVWRPGKEFRLMAPPYGPAIDAHLSHEGNGFSLNIFRNRDKKTMDAEIWISVNEQLQTSKKYPFTYRSDTTNYVIVENDGSCRFKTYKNTTGHVKFTKIDTSNYIVAGTFQFNALDTTCSKNNKMKITDGRFDINYME